MDRHDYHNQESDSGGWIAAVVIFVVFIIIIGLAIWGFSGDTFGPWRFTTTTSTSSASFDGVNKTVFVAAAPADGMTVTMVPPLNPIGQEFIIDNTQGVGTVFLSGVTVTPTNVAFAPLTTNPVIVTSIASTKIAPKTAATFIWESNTMLLRL